MEFLIMFCATVFCAYKVEKVENIRQYKIYSVLVIILPCVLAGLRNESVGTDIATYVVGIVETAQNSNNIFTFYSSDYLHNLVVRPILDIEIGYTLMVYFVTKVFGGLQWVLFFTQLIIMIFIYKTLIKYKEYMSIYMSMILYFGLFYLNDLNHMRQGIAMAITFYAVTILLEKKYVKYVIFVGIAALFHISALMMLGVLIVYFIIQPEFSLKKISIVSGLALLFIILLGPIAQFIISLDIINSRYFFYIQNGWIFDIGVFVTFLPLLFIEIYYYKKSRNTCEAYSFIFLLTILGVISYQLLTGVLQGVRISRYFLHFMMLGIPMALKEEKNSTSRILEVAVVAYCVLYVLYFNVYLNGQAVFPYQFFW